MDSAMGHLASPRWGCPIRRSPDHSLLAAPRGLSQPSTSFIGSWCQGIHRAPLLARRLDLSTSPSRQDQRSLYKKTLAQDLLSVCPERLYLLNYSSILQVREPRGEAQKKPDVRRATTATREVVNTDYAIIDSRLRMVRFSSKVLRSRARQRPLRARESSLYPTCTQARKSSACFLAVEPRGFEPLTSAVQRRRSPN